MSIFRDYFRFGRSLPSRGLNTEKQKQQTTFPLLQIWLQYLAILLGIIVQPLLVQLTKSEIDELSFDFFKGSWIIVSAIIAMVVFPGAYRPQNPSPHHPFVQFAILFTTGIGWQAIIKTFFGA